MRHRRPRRLAPAILGAVLVLVSAGAATAQETVQTAQALYAAAAYDEALAVLDRIQQQGPDAVDPRILNQQRALCLLALGRDQEAELAIAAVVQAEPTFRPSEDAVSPRVRAAFRDVRARLLPGLVQSQYAEARRLYDAESWKEAAEAFRLALALAGDPDLDAAGAQAVADIRVLAGDFARLAEAAATPPPPEPEPEPEPVAPPPPPIDYDRVYDGTEAGVLPAVTVRQNVPRWEHTSVPPPSLEGTLEVIVARDGTVERATLLRAISPLYDHRLLDATKHWRYRPAQFNGRAVRFRKVIRIAFE
jgi:hypothetical protein